MQGLKRWRVSSRLQKSGLEVGPTHRCRAAGKNIGPECKIGRKEAEFCRFDTGNRFRRVDFGGEVSSNLVVDMQFDRNGQWVH